MHLGGIVRPIRLFVLVLGGACALLSGCASSDMVRAAQGSYERALRVENAGAFFGPVIAHACGEASPPPVPAQARQHYLAMIADLEGLTARDKDDLRRQGMLGDALALKTLAQWRLDRVDDARRTAQEARASGQDPLNAHERMMLVAFQGTAQLETAVAAANAGATFEQIDELVRGETGVWKILGAARAEAARAGPVPAELIEARLAAFKVLKDARDRKRAGPPAPGGREETWDRMRAEAQVELGDLAGLPAADAAAHTAAVRRWQILCGLDPAVR